MTPIQTCAHILLRAVATIPTAGIAADNDPILPLLTSLPPADSPGDARELAAQIAPVRDQIRARSQDAAATLRQLEATATSQAVSGGVTPATAAAVWHAQHRAAVLRKVDGTLSQLINALRRGSGWQQVEDLRKAGGALAEALFFALEAAEPQADPSGLRRLTPAA